MEEWTTGEFIRHLRQVSEENQECRFAFFVGAGCSVASGIPTAGGLVSKWLPRLMKIKVGKMGTENEVDAWAKNQFNGYTKETASIFYGKIIESLFPNPILRQKEIMRIVEGTDPSKGYAILSQLMTKHKKQFNIVLTTNFDDLLQNALYLYPNKKPLVITHESLSKFVTLSSIDPIIFKLHGDSRLEPKNTAIETSTLQNITKRSVNKLLSEIGLIFIGYGGNDQSIISLLEKLDTDDLPWGIYWIGSKIPSNSLGKWLENRKAIWIKHRDFEELMEQLRVEFKIESATETRFRLRVN